MNCRRTGELIAFLRAAKAKARDAEDLTRALEVAGPYTRRLAADATGEVFGLAEALVDGIAASLETLPPARVVAALNACAGVGLPHVPLFAAAMERLDNKAGALPLVEALEACAALRLLIPELRPWSERVLAEGLERRLPAVGLARLLTALARLKLLDQARTDALLQRMVAVASPVRPPQLNTVSRLCYGLYLARWEPESSELWQVVSWLAQAEEEAGSAAIPPLQLTSLGYFATGLLASPAARREIEGFPSELRRPLLRIGASIFSCESPCVPSMLLVSLQSVPLIIPVCFVSFHALGVPFPRYFLYIWRTVLF